jgi:hypothetical protein
MEGVSNFGGGGTKDQEFWEILGERVGGGYPFLDQTEIIFS